MIADLYEYGNVILYNRLFDIEEQELDEVSDFLRHCYSEESKDFPFVPPPFDDQAALWAARMVFYSAQLILYRETKNEELTKLIVNYPHNITASAMLSADLCLRFLPDMLEHLRMIDSEDPLVEILMDLLDVWHYSNLKTAQSVALNLDKLFEDACFRNLYVERIIENENLHVASHPLCKPLIDEHLGLYAADFWKIYTLENTHA